MSKEINNNKYLIVNADDFGLAKGMNEGIIYGFRHGIVNRASIMPVGIAFDDAVSLAKQNPGLKIGVHLTLHREKPVMNPKMIKSLVNAKGCFFKDYRGFILRYFGGLINLDEVRLELEAQIKKVLDNGLNINHLDSHNHLGMFPGILKITIDLANKFNIRNIRIPWRSSLMKYSFKEIALQCLIRVSKETIIKSGLRYANYYWGLAENGKIRENTLLNFLDKIKPGVTEIICHLGYADKDFKERYPDWKGCPEIELATFNSAAVKQKILDKKIHLAN